jgi:hypothetical protein
MVSYIFEFFFIRKIVYQLVSEIWTKKLKLKWGGQIIYTIIVEKKNFSLKTCSLR